MAVKCRKDKQCMNASNNEVDSGEQTNKNAVSSFTQEKKIMNIVPDNTDDKDTDYDAYSEDMEKCDEASIAYLSEGEEKISTRNPKKADSSIFVGNAPVGIKVEKIKTYFSKYGKIKKCTVIKDKNQNKFRRTYPPRNLSAIIYIDFTSEEAAHSACEENQKIFEGKRLRVSLARERKPINKEATLFVGNLKYTTTEEQLYDAFIEYGQIDMVRIIAGKGFGFVHYSDPTSVDKAAAQNKRQFNGREIHVERSRPPIKKVSNEYDIPDKYSVNQNETKKQLQRGYMNYTRNQTRNQLALELLERVINVQCRRPKSGIKF